MLCSATVIQLGVVRTITMIILLALVTGVHAYKLTESRIANAQSSMDELIDKWVEKLFDCVLTVWRWNRIDLSSTSLVKLHLDKSHCLAYTKSKFPIPLLPVRDARSRFHHSLSLFPIPPCLPFPVARSISGALDRSKPQVAAMPIRAGSLRQFSHTATNGSHNLVRAMVGSLDQVKQRVAVIGAGAVGLYYGSRLLESGHDVRFLMRRDLDACRAKGLTVESCDGDILFAPEKMREVACARADDIGEVDWILVALKSFALQELKQLAAPLKGSDTKVLAIMNGMGIEDAIADSGICSRENVFGGMAFVCINRGPEGSGVVKHLKYGALTVGNAADDAAQLEQVKSLFQGVNVKLTLSDCLLGSRWEKLCWNLPFNGVATAMGGISTDKIVFNTRLRALARDVMEEVLEASEEDLVYAGKPVLNKDEVFGRMFDLTDNMGPYLSSTVLDLRGKRRLELEYMFLNPLKRAEALGIECPSLRAIVAMVTARADWQRQES